MLRWFIMFAILLMPAPASAQAVRPEADPDAIPDLRVARGDKDITEAWLIAPTGRYRHFVLGSQYEAGGLRVRLRDGAVLELLLDDQHVFEDRQPRLADLDGDGQDEIVLVLTSAADGASLAAFDISDGAIRFEAQTPFIGQPNRWLNPAGIADFDGDGQLEIAFVAMPHLVKRLELWSLVNGAMHKEIELGDVSNHRLGSVHIGMAAVADFDGDGIKDLAVPDGSRRVLRILSFAGETPRERRRLQLSGPADGEISARRAGNGWEITVPLEGGASDTLALRF